MAQLYDWSCDHCGLSYQRPKKRLRHQFCSFACRNKANLTRPKVKLDCQWCGTEILTFPSMATGRKKFCSRTCAGLGRPIPDWLNFTT